MKPPRANVLFASLFVVFILLALGLALWAEIPMRSKGEVYETFWNDDRQFKIVVYRMPMKFAMPGQGSDAPGYVQLCNASGKVMRKKTIEMVQDVRSDDITWSPSNVVIRLVAEWDLPK